MITLEIQNQDEVMSTLKKIGDEDTRRAIVDDFGSYLLMRVQERFETETTPDGEKWQKSQRALEDGGKTLSDTRIFHDSMTYEGSADRLEVGSNHIGAAVHQFGAEIRPKRANALYFRIGGRLIKTQKVLIPAREYLGTNDTDEAEFSNIVHDHWKGIIQ